MKISDLVAAHILKILEECDGNAQIRRNELAEEFGCVPSQINYVITSRFTPEQGYIVESRRGGGGYIRIQRIIMGGSQAIMHTINSVGASLDAATANALLKNLLHQQILDQNTVTLVAAAISEHSYKCIPTDLREHIRAYQFKNMLLTQL